MAEPFATHADVEARWRPLSDAEDDIADQLAIDASDMIRERWADIDDRIAAESVAATSVTRVVAGMVKRAMINADSEGLESRAQTAGPYSVNDKYANPLSTLFFTAADILVFEPDGYTRKVLVGWLA
jgi:hypothetical protein